MAINYDDVALESARQFVSWVIAHYDNDNLLRAARSDHDWAIVGPRLNEAYQLQVPIPIPQLDSVYVENTEE